MRVLTICWCWRFVPAWIAENHGFVDGNKRTGAVAMIEFLAINGHFMDMPNDTTLGALFEAAVTGRMTEEELVEDLSPFVELLSDDPLNEAD
jgi:death-on-curing protein